MHFDLSVTKSLCVLNNNTFVFCRSSFAVEVQDSFSQISLVMLFYFIVVNIFLQSWSNFCKIN